MKTIQLLLSPILFIIMITSLSAQNNTWNGGSTDWHTAANWSLGLPAPAHDVVILATANNPIITLPVSVKSIDIAASATLDNNAMLTVSGSAGSGITVSGTLTNFATGDIAIDNCVVAGIFMLGNGAITNHADADIEINNTGSNGITIFSTTETIVNDGNITIGALGSAGNIGNLGIGNGGTITNNATGTIEINNTGGNGIQGGVTLTILEIS